MQTARRIPTGQPVLHVYRLIIGAQFTDYQWDNVEDVEAGDSAHQRSHLFSSGSAICALKLGQLLPADVAKDAENGDKSTSKQ